MNQRIAKLYDRSLAYFASNGDYVAGELDPEKFAELIIQECANYASRNWEHGHLLAQDLKTHFGVE
jgi:hypothetical protein